MHPIQLLTRQRRACLFVFTLTFVWLTNPGTLHAQQIKFTDVTKAMKAEGYTRVPKTHPQDTVSCFGHGSIMADITGDLLPDIYISNAVRRADNQVQDKLYISYAGRPYVAETNTRGLKDKYGLTGSHGISFLDYDNDGDFDVYNATTDDRNRLYRNLGNANYEDVTDQAGLPKFCLYIDQPGFAGYECVGYGTRGVVAFDANNDGYMDLLGVNWGPVEDANEQPWPTPEQPNEFYMNDGDGTFTYDAGNSRGLSPMNPTNIGTQGVTAIDVDNDNDIDVFVSHRNYALLSTNPDGSGNFGPDWEQPSPNQLFINDGSGHFTDETQQRKIYDAMNDCNGTTFADYDNDGDLDAFVVPKGTTSHSRVQVYVNDGHGNFDNKSTETNIEQTGFSCLFLDADNDGDLDIIAPRTYRDVYFYRNDGGGRFTRIGTAGFENTPIYDPRGASIGDIDNDGDVDVYWVDANKDTVAKYSNRLFRNDTPTSNGWLKVTGRGPRGDMGAFGSKIWVFDKGYMDDMSHLVGYRQVQNTYGYLCQDDPVQHFGLGQRDSVDVKVLLLDSTIFQVYRVPAKRRIFFNKPSAMAYHDGDGQQAFAGQALPKPLSVILTYTDLSGASQPAIGVPVTFTVMTGNGSFGQTQPVYTNLQGIAQTIFVLGTTSLDQTVRATCSLIPGVTVDFTLHAQQSGPAILKLVSTENPTGTVGLSLSDSVKIQVTDTANEGQANHPVHFEVVSGNGRLFPDNVNAMDRTTNAAGYAAVAWQLGTASGSQQLRITSLNNGTPLSGSPKIVTATAVAGAVIDIYKQDGDGQTGAVDSLLVPPLVAKAMDQYGNPVSSAALKFEVIAGGGQIDSTNSVNKTTNAEGLASVQWRLGKVAGAEQRVRVSLNTNPAIYTDFTATATAGKAAEMVWLDSDTLSGPVNKALPDSLSAKVVDAFGNAVKDFAVTFAVTAGGGLVNGQANVHVATNAQGFAKVQWQLGPTVGSLNNTLTVTASGLSGSPKIVRASGTPEKPFSIVKGTNGGGDQQSGVPLATLDDSLVVVVKDSLGNPFRGQQVVFTIESGDAFFGSAKTANRTSDVQGSAIVSVKMGTKAGPIAISSTASYNGKSLVNSPLAFSAQLVPGPVDQTKSQITASSPVIANGRARSTISVSLKDAHGNAISGQNVELHNTGIGTMTQPAGGTDANGMATGYLSSTQAGVKTVWAEVNSAVVTRDSAQVVFTPGAPALISKVDGDGQSGVVGRFLDDPLVAALTDSFGNKITAATLSVQHQVPGGQLTPLPDVITDAEGRVSILYQLSANPGIHQVIISYGNLPPATFQAEAVLGVPASIEKISGNDQKVPKGTDLPAPLVVKVKDAQGDSLLGLPVTFSLVSGTGAFIGNNPDTTDTHGLAQIGFRMGNEDGTRIIRASVPGLQQYAEFQCSVRSAQIAHIEIASGNLQSTHPSATLPLPLVVRLEDELNEPGAGASVQFSVIKGDGKVDPTSPVVANEQGLASAKWTLGVSGQQQVKAQVVGTPNLSVVFDASISTNRLPTIVCPADTTVNEMQPLTFVVKATDADGDVVRFTASNLPSGASFDDSTRQFAWTPSYEQAGSYQVLFTGKDGYGGIVQQTSRITVVNVNRAPQITQYFPPENRVMVNGGDRIIFKVWANDPDGNLPIYYWTFNKVYVGDKDSLAVIANPSLPESSTVKVKVSDGDKFVEQIWTLVISTGVDRRDAVLQAFNLEQNYPNPFNPTTAIAFNLPRRSHVRITLFNETGQLVRTLTDQAYPSGSFTLVWDARNDGGQTVPSGIYYYQMEAESFKEVKKLLLLK